MGVLCGNSMRVLDSEVGSVCLPRLTLFLSRVPPCLLHALISQGRPFFSFHACTHLGGRAPHHNSWQLDRKGRPKRLPLGASRLRYSLVVWPFATRKMWKHSNPPTRTITTAVHRANRWGKNWLPLRTSRRQDKQEVGWRSCMMKC